MPCVDDGPLLDEKRPRAWLCVDGSMSDGSTSAAGPRKLPPETRPPTPEILLSRDRRARVLHKEPRATGLRFLGLALLLEPLVALGREEVQHLEDALLRPLQSRWVMAWVQ